MNEKYPLGVPVNRPITPATAPVPGRPNWWRDLKGLEKYIEPPRPKPDPLAASERPSDGLNARG